MESSLAGTVLRDGVRVDIMQPNDNPLHLGLSPVGPSWRWGPYALGADSQGRDVAARMLYGARASLLIAFSAACLCLVMATLCGLLAGYCGGWVDIILSRLLDILWAVPVYLFAISLSVVTIGHDLSFGPFHLQPDSLLLPIGIIALIYVPYAARPIRRVQKACRMPASYWQPAGSVPLPCALCYVRSFLFWPRRCWSFLPLSWRYVCWRNRHCPFSASVFRLLQLPGEA